MKDLQAMLELRCNQGQLPACDYADTKLVVTQGEVDKLFSQIQETIEACVMLLTSGKHASTCAVLRVAR